MGKPGFNNDDMYRITSADLPTAQGGQVRPLDEVLNDHVAHCVEGAIASGDSAEQRRKVQELLTVLTRRDG